MAANPNTPGAQVTGTVASVNSKGIRLEGHADWLNFSRFAEVVPPMRGQFVTATLDKQGWVRAIEATDGHQSPVAGRDATITHLAVLEAAAACSACRPELKSADLFALAEKMETWAGR